MSGWFRLSVCGAMLIVQSLAFALPAPPILTVYQFAGADDFPIYAITDLTARDPSAPFPLPVGALAQGTSVVPCLVVKDAIPLTFPDGSLALGVSVIVDSRNPGADVTARLQQAIEHQEKQQVSDHHCPAQIKYAISARYLSRLQKKPSFEPDNPKPDSLEIKDPRNLDQIVRAFHQSTQCAAVNRTLFHRRTRLIDAWKTFIAQHAKEEDQRWFNQAAQLDIVMRTALYEGHIGRGCSAYGSCERNVVALSIRNRALELCQRNQGCRYQGDLIGAATTPNQYNIWDEYLTQVSGLTSCFLRPDLAQISPYKKLQQMYEQNRADFEQILFGGEAGLKAVFVAPDLPAVQSVRNYYHAPAMGKCTPNAPNISWISAAAAQRDQHWVLIAGTRVEVTLDKEGYRFKMVRIDDSGSSDVIHKTDAFSGFVLPQQAVTLGAPKLCQPYGIPRGCALKSPIERYRRVPTWLAVGKPIGLTCQVRARAAECDQAESLETVVVGDTCDREMRPVGDVP